MTKPQEPRTGDKRGPGRPRNSATPAPKRARTSIPAAATPPVIASPPAVDSPAPGSKRLPAKIAENRPLPSLPAPQPSSLSKDDYHSIAASAVLAASIERSRLNWACNGLFKRYWIKPESGKNAKPPPPGNPDAKCMKAKGECRLRIEPHIFEAEVYVEERPKQPTAPKQYAPTTTQSPYGVAPRPQQTPQAQQRPPAANGQTPIQPVQRSNTPIQPHPQPQQRAQQGTAAPGTQPEKKADPVISMLAARASSNAELKALMKEVATGNATQEQLTIFQRHIDELTGIIQKQKGDVNDHGTNGQPQSNAIQYDGPADVKPQPPPPPLQPQSRPTVSTPQAPPTYHQQATWSTPPPAPTSFPVLLDFSKKTPGGTEDRFLFPQYSVLEALSRQHLLVSFIITRRGKDAADPTGLDPEKQYWQPVTMMVEVAFTREETLSCIRRWVKPLEEVRQHMEQIMKTCIRAPEAHLAMRLPVRGIVPESEEPSKEATPLVEEKPKPIARPKSTVKYVKRSSTSKAPDAPLKQQGEASKEQSSGTAKSTPAPSSVKEQPADKKSDDISTPVADGTAEASAASDTGRPKRAVRKSVRISEG